MTPEKRLMNEIRLYCATKGWIVFRTNVGRVMTIDGTYFDTGLPKGFPDMFVLTDNGKAIFVETKIHPRKPTKQQREMIELLKLKKFIAFVCYSLEEFIENTRFA